MFLRYKIRHASSLESGISFYVCFVTGNSKTVTVPWKRCVLRVHVLLCFPLTVGLTYICTLPLTPAVILQAWQALIQTCTQTQLLFISSSMFVWYSFMREFASLSPPAAEACADCPTAGVPGSLYHSLCPALCPLQLAVLDFCTHLCRLCTQAAGVPSKSLPSSQPTLPLTNLESTHFFSLNLVFFIFSTSSSSSINVCSAQKAASLEQLKMPWRRQ